jgi:hypothetical protein
VPHSFAYFANEWVLRTALVSKLFGRTRRMSTLRPLKVASHLVPSYFLLYLCVSTFAPHSLTLCLYINQHWRNHMGIASPQRLCLQDFAPNPKSIEYFAKLSGA